MGGEDSNEQKALQTNLGLDQYIRAPETVIDGYIFIDRDPEAFYLIVNMLRDSM